MVDIKELNPLDGWVIAQCHGLTLLGKQATTERQVPAAIAGNGEVFGTQTAKVDCLSPVFELKTAMAQDGRGNAGPVRMAFPLFLFAISSVELPEGALVVPSESLSRTEQNELRRAIDVGEDMLSKAKAAASGITVARDIPKVHG